MSKKLYKALEILIERLKGTSCASAKVRNIRSIFSFSFFLPILSPHRNFNAIIRYKDWHFLSGRLQ